MPPFDWKALLDMAAPVVGTIATHGNGRDEAFMHSYMQGRYIASQEQQQAQDRAQRAKQFSGNYALQALQHLSSVDDPVQYEQAKNLFAQHSPDATVAEQIRGFHQSPSNKGDAKLTEISGLLDMLEKNGYSLEDLEASGSHIQLKDGTDVPIGTAVSLTRKRPLDGSNQPIQKPKKVDANASTDYGRALARYAKDLGKKVDDLTFDEELAAKTKYGQAGDALKNPPRPATGAEGQFEDLVSLWKESHPGQEPPAAVRAQLRVKATKDIGQADDRPPVTLNIPGLTDMTPQARVESAAQDIVNNRMAPSQLATFFVGMGKDSASQLRSLVMQRVKQIKPEFNFAQAEANYKFGSSTGTQSTVRFLDNIEKTLPVLEQASQDFKRSNVQVINKALLAGKKQFGATDVVKFEFARNILADEIAKILQGGGTGSGTSDAKLKQAQDLLSGDMTVDQFSTALATAKELLGTRRGSLTSGTFMDRSQAPAPAGGGGVSVQAPNGKTYTFQSQAQADAFKAKAGIR